MPESIPEFDLYLELEVHELASVETVEAAWRSLSKRFHPDVTCESVESVDRMTRLNVARTWLTDPVLRRACDEARLDGSDATAGDRRRAQVILDDDSLADALELIGSLDSVVASVLERRLGVTTLTPRS